MRSGMRQFAACASGRARSGFALAHAFATNANGAASRSDALPLLPLRRGVHYHQQVIGSIFIGVPVDTGLRVAPAVRSGIRILDTKVMAMISSAVQRGGRALAAFVLPASVLLASAAACANPVPWQLNMAPGATSISRRIYGLHMLGLWVCVAIGVIVFGAMIIAMIRFRKSKGAVAATWSHSTQLEAIWTIVPIIILIAMAWPATKLLVDMANVGNADMTIKITGYQWRWAYDYVDYNKKSTGVHFISSLDADSYRVSQLRSGLDPDSVKDGDDSTYLLNVDHPLVLPVGVKIGFVITADDVIHSWSVPNLGWKTDAIPGIINSNWTRIDTPGVYRGQCAELCGRGHGYMPIVVKAVPKAEFEQWLAAQTPPAGAAPAAATAVAPAPVAAAAAPQS